jgi:hypothetical protein
MNGTNGSHPSVAAAAYRIAVGVFVGAVVLAVTLPVAVVRWWLR